MNSIVFEVLMALVMLVTALIARHLIPYLKQSLEESKHEWLLDIVAAAVRAVEQTILGEKNGPEKKAIVTEKIREILIQKNIDMTDEQLDMLIEAAVFSMNKG